MMSNGKTNAEIEHQSIFDSFKTKVDELFVTGYNLPNSLHVTAIENIDGKLEAWKGRLAQENEVDQLSEFPWLQIPDNAVAMVEESIIETIHQGEILENDLSSTCHGDLSKETSPTIKQEAIEPDTSALGDVARNDDDVRMETSVSVGNDQDGEDSDHADGYVAPVESPVTKKKKKRKPSKKNNTRKRSNTVTPVRPSSRKKSAHISTKVLKKDSKKSGHPLKSESGTDTSANADVDNENLLKKGFPKRCALCFKEYSSRSGFVGHMKRHSEGSFPCEQCTFVGVTNMQLRSHTFTAHVEERPFDCKECGKKLRSAWSLNIHMSLHLNGSFKCPECSKEFMSQVNYDNHMRLHTGENLHKCDLCPYVVGIPSMLTAHVQRVHERVEKYLCDVCGRGFVTTYRLKRHREVTHLREELKDRYPCPHCDHKTHCAASLKAHVKYMHTKTPGFMCNICGITLKYKTHLADHQKRHYSEKNYQCQQCDFRGTCRQDVKNHIRRTHLLPTLECDICNKKFKQKSHLRRHKVIHTGEKQFSCRLCTYCCNVQGNLRKHMLQVHNKDERIRPVIQKFDM